LNLAMLCTNSLEAGAEKNRGIRVNRGKPDKEENTVQKNHVIMNMALVIVTSLMTRGKENRPALRRREDTVL